MTIATAPNAPFNALEFVKNLTKAGMPKRQAEVLASQYVADRNVNVEIRADLERHKVEINAKIETRIAELETRLIRWSVGLVVSVVVVMVALEKLL